MSKYEKLEKLVDEEFKRATGIQRKTFFEMVKIVEKSESESELGIPNTGIYNLAWPGAGACDLYSFEEWASK